MQLTFEYKKKLADKIENSDNETIKDILNIISKDKNNNIKKTKRGILFNMNKLSNETIEKINSLLKTKNDSKRTKPSHTFFNNCSKRIEDYEKKLLLYLLSLYNKEKDIENNKKNVIVKEKVGRKVKKNIKEKKEIKIIEYKDSKLTKYLEKLYEQENIEKSYSDYYDSNYETEYSNTTDKYEESESHISSVYCESLSEKYESSINYSDLDDSSISCIE